MLTALVADVAPEPSPGPSLIAIGGLAIVISVGLIVLALVRRRASDSSRGVLVAGVVIGLAGVGLMIAGIATRPEPTRRPVRPPVTNTATTRRLTTTPEQPG